MIWPRLLPRLDLALLLAMATAWAISHRQGLDVAAIEAAVGDMGAWAPLAYISLFALAAVLFVPGSILSLAGGGLFGPVWGKAYALLGATVGATLAFLAARYLASDWVVATAGGRLKQLAEGVEAEGWRFIAFVRLVALFPFNLVNYALGLTRVRLLDYSLASLVSMAPGAIAYTYLGCAGREAVAGGDALVQKGLMALGLVALLAFFPRVVRRLRSYSFTWLDAAQLPERIGNGAALMIIDVRGPDEFNGELGHLGGAKTSRSPSFLGASATSINSRSKRWCSAAERRRARQGRRSRSSRRVSATSPCCVAEWRNGAASGSRSRKKRVSPSKGCLDLNGRRSFKRSANAPMRLYVR